VSGREQTIVAGVLLAAGSSRRMGRDKLYLELEGESLLRRAARRALEAGLDPVLVVTGPDPERAQRELAGHPVRLVWNPEHRQGQNTSLSAGIRHVPPPAAAALVVLADMPFVTSAMMRDVVHRYRGGRPPLIVSRYGEVTAPPTLYDRSLFAELTGGRFGRDVVRRHLGEAAVLDWPDERLADLDVEADHARAREKLERPRGGRAE